MKDAPQLRLATFNAGLAVGVLPHALERLPHVVSALANLEVDLLFVQEFWLDPHWEALCAAARARFPHAFRAAPAEAPRHGVCTQEEVAPLVACARAHCAGLTSDALARCVVHRCASAAIHMSPQCLNCVARNPLGSLDEIITPCVAANDTPEPASAARSPSRRHGYSVPGLVAYGGSYGTGLLSALPLGDRDELVYEATTNARGALHARITHPGFGDLHVFATHFSPGPHDEQLPQVERLLAWIEEKAGRDERAVLLGDLNTGPSSSLYRRIEAAGFHNPYTDQPDPPATYPDGSFSSRGMGRSGWLLDHILLRGFSEPATAARILDEPLTLEEGGQKVRTTYSDHCGILVSVGKR